MILLHFLPSFIYSIFSLSDRRHSHSELPECKKGKERDKDMENVIERALNGDIEEDSESQYGREEHSPVISSSSHSKFPNWFHSKSSPDDTGNVYGNLE